jgi:hypothetical protein
MKKGKRISILFALVLLFAVCAVSAAAEAPAGASAVKVSTVDELIASIAPDTTVADPADVSDTATTQGWSTADISALNAAEQGTRAPLSEETSVGELVELVKEQIEYDVLCTRDNPQPLLDCAVEVISRVLHMPQGERLTIRGAEYRIGDIQRTLSALDANEAEYAIQAVHGAIERARERGTPIRNVRSYLLACLFTAKTDFATSLVY